MTVYLVGAGPGDPELLTLKAARLLAAADVVVYDRLIGKGLTELAPDRAERIDVGKRAGEVTVPQDEINALLVDRGRTGATVVRLKGGDPFIFGRGGEEAGALLAAGVPFEVVPGVSSALAGPAAAGIPVTMRAEALAVTVVTGHERADGGSVDWEAMAATGATLVILMGAARIGAIAARLVAGGLAPSTPVAVVRWATTNRQEILRTTLAEVGAAEVHSPCTIVVGTVAGHDLRWPG